ncbi:MAG: hypothetical protein K9L86_02905 [Candidatus Omnitrophica bacterium]|nr:hypothetical protein [Candidatus Omnitrophota bacterium]
MRIICFLNPKLISSHKIPVFNKNRYIISYDEFKPREAITRDSNLKQIIIFPITNQERATCEREYIANVSKLSEIFDSLEWWANPISEKNEHSSIQYKDLCLFFSLIKTIDKHRDERCDILVYGDGSIYNILRKHYSNKGIQVVFIGSKLFRNIQSFIYQILKIVLLFFKIISRKLFLRKIASKLRKQLSNKSCYYVIRTWLYNQPDANFRNDAFFGRLPEYAANRGNKVLLLGGIIDNYRKILQKILKSDGKTIVIPEEYFLKYSDIFKLFVYFKFKIRKLDSKIIFKGIDVTDYYSQEIFKGFWQDSYIYNIIRYMIAKRFGETVNFNVFLQTFENYAWEKVTIKGIKAARSNCRVLGFQHAFVSRNSFKYFPGQQELDRIPLPDKIITMGERTKEILQNYGAYRKEQIVVGCALRQQYLDDLSFIERRRCNKILVPLTMVTQESIRIIKFLCDSNISKTNKNIVIRPHPARDFKSVKEKIPFEIPSNFIINNCKTMKEELSDAGMVLYTWSTISAEALRLGLPVIYLDILRPLYVDPLFECDALKRKVSEADELVPAVDSLYGISNDDFEIERKMASEYSKSYFYPVTESNLAHFFS